MFIFVCVCKSVGTHVFMCMWRHKVIVRNLLLYLLFHFIFFFEVRSLNQAQSSVMSLVFLLARLLNGFPDIAWVCSFRWAVLLSLHLGGFWGISSGPLIIPALRSFSLTSVTLPNLLFHEQSTLHYLASPRFHPSLLPLVVHSNTGCKDTYLKCIRQKCRSHLHNDHLA